MRLKGVARAVPNCPGNPALAQPRASPAPAQPLPSHTCLQLFVHQQVGAALSHAERPWGGNQRHGRATLTAMELEGWQQRDARQQTRTSTSHHRPASRSTTSAPAPVAATAHIQTSVPQGVAHATHTGAQPGTPAAPRFGAPGWCGPPPAQATVKTRVRLSSLVGRLKNWWDKHEHMWCVEANNWRPKHRLT